MKIALCLSGQSRSVKAGYEFHKKNILDGNDVIVIIGYIFPYSPLLLL